MSLHSIQTKIMTVSLLIAAGTAVASLIISFYAEINTIKSTTERYTEQYISFADREFNSMLSESKKIVLSVALAQEFISPNLVRAGEEASYKGFRQKKQIKSFLAGFLSQKEYIEDILLITGDGPVYQAGSGIVMKRELDTPAMKRALSSDSMELIYDAEGQSLLLSHPVTYCQGNTRGVIVVKLNYEFITSVYTIDFLRSVALYLYLPDGQLFYTNSGEEERQGPVGEVRQKGPSAGYVKWKGDPYYYIRYVSDASHMTLISLIPQNVLLKDAQELKTKFLLIGAAASAAALLAAAYLSKRICADLKCLSGGMEAVRSGNLGVRMKIPARDEIGALADTFNVMMDRIEALMAEVRQKEKLKREAQQDVLASQIEPHFLYNSIDSIQYVAHSRDEKEIEAVAASLSELLRSVLSNHNEFITLWEEKDYIENYLTIERFKYRRPFTVLWDVEEELWSYPVPKLLLQPVVENALIHGIAAMDGDGVINVKIYRQQDTVILKVMDNGRGISEDKLEELKHHMASKGKPGFRRIGITNVFNRIQLIYGDGYGGTIASCEGMFTCVELHLPAGGEKDGLEDFTG